MEVFNNRTHVFVGHIIIGIYVAVATYNLDVLKINNVDNSILLSIYIYTS